MRVDIHSYDRKLETARKKLENSDISDRNKALIRDFDNNCFVRGLGNPRREKYLVTLRLIAKIINKDFDNATKEDNRIC